VVQGRICSFVVGALLSSAVAAGCSGADGVADVQDPMTDESSGGIGGDPGGQGGAGQSNIGGKTDAAFTPGPDTSVKQPDAGTGMTPDAQVADAKPVVGASTLIDEKIVWNGDGVGNGGGAQWMGRGQEGKTTLKYSDVQSFSSKHAVAFTLSNIGYGEFGWGISGMPANKYKKIGFWANMVPDAGKSAPGNALFTLRVGGGYAAPGGGRGVETIKYNRTGLKGGWQQIVIPVADIVGSPIGANITEILIGITGCGSAACSFTLYIDDIAFGN